MVPTLANTDPKILQKCITMSPVWCQHNPKWPNRSPTWSQLWPNIPKASIMDKNRPTEPKLHPHVLQIKNWVCTRSMHPPHPSPRAKLHQLPALFQCFPSPAVSVITRDLERPEMMILQHASVVEMFKRMEQQHVSTFSEVAWLFQR